MQAAIEPRLTHHLGHQPVVFEIVLSILMIPTEEASGYECGGDHFRIAQLHSHVLLMPDRFEQVIGDGINRYNFTKHFSLSP
jgi:hypothetical protein